MDWSLTDAAIYGLNRHCCQTTGRKHGCSSRRQIPSQSSRRFDIPQLQHDSNSNRSHQIIFITITITIIIIIIIIIWECCYSPTLTVLDGHEFANGILYALRNSSVFRCQWKDMTDSCWFRTVAAWQSVPSRWCCNSKATRTAADTAKSWLVERGRDVRLSADSDGQGSPRLADTSRSGNLVRDCTKSWTWAHPVCSYPQSASLCSAFAD